MNYPYKLVASDGEILASGESIEDVEMIRRNKIKGFKSQIKSNAKEIETYRKDVGLDEARAKYCKSNIDYFIFLLKKYEDAIFVKEAGAESANPYKIFFDKLRDEEEIEIRLFNGYMSIRITDDDETTAEDMIRLTGEEYETLKGVIEE